MTWPENGARADLARLVRLALDARDVVSSRPVPLSLASGLITSEDRAVICAATVPLGRGAVEFEQCYGIKRARGRGWMPGAEILGLGSLASSSTAATMQAASRSAASATKRTANTRPFDGSRRDVRYGDAPGIPVPTRLRSFQIGVQIETSAPPRAGAELLRSIFVLGARRGTEGPGDEPTSTPS